jgi:hypothetical protein
VGNAGRGRIRWPLNGPLILVTCDPEELARRDGNCRDVSSSRAAARRAFQPSPAETEAAAAASGLEVVRLDATDRIAMVEQVDSLADRLAAEWDTCNPELARTKVAGALLARSPESQ